METEITLTANETLALDSLRMSIEDPGQPAGSWCLVYLDNAKPADWAPATWAGVLGSLAKKGLYKEDDGYAWGLVLYG